MARRKLTMKSSTHIAAALALLTIFIAAPLIAAPDANTTQPPKPAQPLDQQLLDDLNADLGLDKASVDTAPRTNQFDQELLDQLSHREDIQPGIESRTSDTGRANPLSDIAHRMRQVQTRIGAADVSHGTQMIEETIVSDLNALIEQCQKQCQAGKSSSQTDNPGQPQPGASQSAARAGKPSESTERLGQKDAKQAYLESVRALIKETWGHLPDRAREPMISSGVDRFVPEYEEIIEDYFRHLARQQESGK